MLEFNENKKIVLIDNHSEGDGSKIERTYDEIVSGAKDWIDNLSDETLVKEHQDILDDNPVLYCADIYEIEQGYEVVVDTHDTYLRLTEFLIEQKLLKLCNHLFTEEDKKRVVSMAVYSENRNLEYQLREILQDTLLDNKDAADMLLEDIDLNNPQQYFKPGINLQELMDKYNYPLYISDEQLDRIENKYNDDFNFQCEVSDLLLSKRVPLDLSFHEQLKQLDSASFNEIYAKAVEGLKSYRIVAEMSLMVETTIEAKSEEEAYALAKGLDGDVFSEVPGSGHWNIESVTSKEDVSASLANEAENITQNNNCTVVNK